MKLSKAKELIENGTHYIFEDDTTKFSKELIEVSKKYFDVNKCRIPISISEITDDEEIVYQLYKEGNWIDSEYLIRIKPKLDFQKELDALYIKAKECGIDVVVSFEKKL